MINIQIILSIIIAVMLLYIGMDFLTINFPVLIPDFENEPESEFNIWKLIMT